MLEAYMTQAKLRQNLRNSAITAAAVRMEKQHYIHSFHPSDQLRRQRGIILDVTSAHTPITVNVTQQHRQSLLPSVPLVVCPDQTGPIHRQDPIANFQSAIRGSGSIGDQRADVNSWSVEGSVLRQRGGGLVQKPSKLHHHQSRRKTAELRQVVKHPFNMCRSCSSPQVGSLGRVLWASAQFQIK